MEKEFRPNSDAPAISNVASAIFYSQYVAGDTLTETADKVMVAIAVTPFVMTLSISSLAAKLAEIYIIYTNRISWPIQADYELLPTLEKPYVILTEIVKERSPPNRAYVALKI